MRSTQVTHLVLLSVVALSTIALSAIILLALVYPISVRIAVTSQVLVVSIPTLITLTLLVQALETYAEVTHLREDVNRINARMDQLIESTAMNATLIGQQAQREREEHGP